MKTTEILLRALGPQTKTAQILKEARAQSLLDDDRVLAKLAGARSQALKKATK